jgi:hypothetical protein
MQKNHWLQVKLKNPLRRQHVAARSRVHAPSSVVVSALRCAVSPNGFGVIPALQLGQLPLSK